MLRHDLPAAKELLRLVYGSWATQAIACAVELRVPDLLASGVTGLEDLANATGCHQASLHRLLRALASLGVCDEPNDRSFTLTSMGSLLQSDTPTSIRTLALWAGRYQWSVGNILHSVKTGESSSTFCESGDSFAHMEQHPEAAEIFHRAMTESTRLVAEAVVSAYDFTPFGSVVDIGGGYGEMLVAILRACHKTGGVLFDLPHVLDGARRRLAQAGVAHRCEFVAGDFFSSIPSGADGYLLKSVIHDWPDERAKGILSQCRDAMARDAKLVIVERIMPGAMALSPLHQDMARRDLTMLVMLGGRERTASEYEDLLRAAKFRVTAIIPAALNFGIIEAIPT